jgi:hypothetical protein
MSIGKLIKWGLVVGGTFLLSDVIADIVPLAGRGRKRTNEWCREAVTKIEESVEKRKQEEAI